MIVTSEEINTFIELNGTTVTADQQDFLSMTAPFIQKQIEKVIGTPIEQATITEYYPDKITNFSAGGDFFVGNWDVLNGRVVSQVRGEQSRKVLGLRKGWVRSITEIRENLGAWDTAGGSFPDSSILPTSAYYLDIDEDAISRTARVVRNHGIWTRELRCIKITYTYGLTQGEINSDYTDLKLALLTAVQAFYIGTVMRSNAGASGGPVASVSITDFSTSFMTPDQLGIYFGANYTLPPESIALLGRYVNLSSYF